MKRGSIRRPDDAPECPKVYEAPGLRWMREESARESQMLQRIRELERIAEAAQKYRERWDLGFSVAPLGGDARNAVYELKGALDAAGYKL